MNTKHCTHCAKLITRKVHPNTEKAFCDSTCYGLWQRGRTFGDQGKPPRDKLKCSVAGCAESHAAKGYCRKHYLSLAYKAPKTPTKFTRTEPITCMYCGAKFIAHHAEPKYCSIACASSARRKPFILKKGYRKILLQSHPRADGKGYVFEHILIAEATLGRSLTSSEVVHHRDFNKQNNAPDNLLVCASHSEHMAYHATPS